MKKSEAFDSSLKKTFDECCEGEGWEIEFEELPHLYCDCSKNCPDRIYSPKDIKSFISSLLAKQQAEFVKCIPEEKRVQESDDFGALGYNQCIADIKSKLESSQELRQKLQVNDIKFKGQLAQDIFNS
jgi:hypothetical protein